MFDIRDPQTSKAIMDGLGKNIKQLIDGCAILFGIMVLTLLGIIAYLIYVICTT